MKKITQKKQKQRPSILLLAAIVASAGIFNGFVGYFVNSYWLGDYWQEKKDREEFLRKKSPLEAFASPSPVTETFYYPLSCPFLPEGKLDPFFSLYARLTSPLTPKDSGDEIYGKSAFGVSTDIPSPSSTANQALFRVDSSLPRLTYLTSDEGWIYAFDAAETFYSLSSNFGDWSMEGTPTVGGKMAREFVNESGVSLLPFCGPLRLSFRTDFYRISQEGEVDAKETYSYSVSFSANPICGIFAPEGYEEGAKGQGFVYLPSYQKEGIVSPKTVMRTSRNPFFSYYLPDHPSSVPYRLARFILTKEGTAKVDASVDLRTYFPGHSIQFPELMKNGSYAFGFVDRQGNLLYRRSEWYSWEVEE